MARPPGPVPPIVAARGITRVYPGGTVANDGVDLRIAPGTVHAVVGENGAGKSTLMKILFGLERPDAGTLEIDGRARAFAGPGEAIAAGVGMVFQHFSLVPSFTVTENVVLGAEPRGTWRGARFDREAAVARVRDLSARFRLPVDPLARVRDLPVGQQQRVEILKALHREARLLILDEPTAVLAPQEVVELFAAVRALTAQGRTIVFIAHKLPEVLAVSDHITVLRAGRSVARVATPETSEAELAGLMVGREVRLRVARASAIGAAVLEVAGLTAGPATRPRVADVSLTVRAGEIVGLVGVEGNGQAELIEALAGLRPVSRGRIMLCGGDITDARVLARRAAGVALIPEDRIAQGLAPGASVAENLVATRLGDPRFARAGLLDLAAIRGEAARAIAQFSIRAGGPGVAASTLSGGNMQKVVVARELATPPRLLLVNQPTRGVDLGATQFIWERIAGARDDGAAVLLASADLSELLALADRLIVFHAGRIVAALANDGVTPETLGAYMLGSRAQDACEIAAGAMARAA